MTTKQFLQHFPGFCVQTFDDREEGEKRGELVRCGKPTDFSKEELEELNKAGAGIYFTPNRFPKGRRRQIDCEGINAWFVESDTLSLEEQKKRLSTSPLPPSFIVKSKKSLHAYWLAKDATIPNALPILRGLRDFFSGDSSVCDIARVLRVPGFLHQKDPSKPIMVELVEANPEYQFHETDMLKAFPYVLPVVSLPKDKPVTLGTFWETLGSLSNRMVLERLSGSEICNREIISFKPRRPEGEYIYVNGKMCDGWLDSNGMIGSGKRGGPTWIQWLGFYGKSKSEIALWAKQYLSDCIPEELKTIDGKPIIVQKPSSLKDEIQKELDSPPSLLTWGSEFLDRKLPILQQKRFYVAFGQQGSGKSLFCLWCAKKNAEKINDVFYLSLEMSKQQMIRNYILLRAGVGKEEYRSRKIPSGIVDRFLPELENINIIGIEEGEVYDLAKIKSIISLKRPKILFIDNLNKIKSFGTELEATQSTTDGLLKLTREFEVAIILIHHANKPTEKQRKGSPYNLRGLSGLRGSNKTNDDADVVLEIARPEMDFNQNKSNALFLAAYKDRDFDQKTLLTLFLEEGNFYDEETSQLGAIAKTLGGKIVPDFT